jgi:predicted metal-binding transcription factor (methanogenesis marker protein 9)
VKYCDDDYVNQLELSESEIVDLKKSLRKTILSDNQSIPMVCSGHKCVFGDICPLVKIDKPPVGKRCSIELLLLNKWKDEYVKSLNIARDVKNMVSTRRSKLLKEMIATREAKAKFVSDMRADPATYAARLRDKAKELRDEKIIDIDEDDIEDIDEQ